MRLKVLSAYLCPFSTAANNPVYVSLSLRKVPMPKSPSPSPTCELCYQVSYFRLFLLVCLIMPSTRMRISLPLQPAVSLFIVFQSYHQGGCVLGFSIIRIPDRASICLFSHLMRCYPPIHLLFTSSLPTSQASAISY